MAWVKVGNVRGPQGAQGPKGDTGEQGPAGARGPAGAAGNGVKSAAVTYQLGSSATTAPTGAWSSAIPAPAAGKYLWTRMVVTMTDGTEAIAYGVTPVPIFSVDGSGNLYYEV